MVSCISTHNFCEREYKKKLQKVYWCWNQVPHYILLQISGIYMVWPYSKPWLGFLFFCFACIYVWCFSNSGSVIIMFYFRFRISGISMIWPYDAFWLGFLRFPSRGSLSSGKSCDGKNHSEKYHCKVTERSIGKGTLNCNRKFDWNRWPFILFHEE